MAYEKKGDFSPNQKRSNSSQSNRNKNRYNENSNQDERGSGGYKGERGRNQSYNKDGYNSKEGNRSQNSRSYGQRSNNGSRDGYNSEQSHNKGSYGGKRDYQGQSDSKRGYKGNSNQNQSGAYQNNRTNSYENNNRNYEKKSYGRRDDDFRQDDFRNYEQEATQYDDVKAEAEQPEGPMIIYGRNSVREAVKSNRSIDKVFVLDTGKEDGSLREIVRLIKEKNLVMVPVSRHKLDEMTIPYGYDGKPANHQGIIAQMPEVEYVEVDDILQAAYDKQEKPFLLLLDGISDPHNLGAILRTAECAGVHGVVIPKRRAASITASAMKASAGAALHVKVARVPNLNNVAKKLKESGVWIIGAEMGETTMSDVRLDGALALVIGSEGEGISKGLRDNCDALASIPMFGEINSLNASNAAAILIYEKLHQDQAAK